MGNHFHAILLEGNMYEDAVMTATFVQDGEKKSGALHMYTGLLDKMKILFHTAGSPFCTDNYEMQHQGMVVSSLEELLKEQHNQSNKAFQSLSKQVYPVADESSLARFYRDVVTFFEDCDFNPPMTSPNPLGTQVFDSVFQEMLIQ